MLIKGFQAFSRSETNRLFQYPKLFEMQLPNLYSDTQTVNISLQRQWFLYSSNQGPGLVCCPFDQDKGEGQDPGPLSANCSRNESHIDEGIQRRADKAFYPRTRSRQWKEVSHRLRA